MGVIQPPQVLRRVSMWSDDEAQKKINEIHALSQYINAENNGILLSWASGYYFSRRSDGKRIESGAKHDRDEAICQIIESVFSWNPLKYDDRNWKQESELSNFMALACKVILLCSRFSFLLSWRERIAPFGEICNAFSTHLEGGGDLDSFIYRDPSVENPRPAKGKHRPGISSEFANMEFSWYRPLLEKRGVRRNEFGLLRSMNRNYEKGNYYFDLERFFPFLAIGAKDGSYLKDFVHGKLLMHCDLGSQWESILRIGIRNWRVQSFGELEGKYKNAFSRQKASLSSGLENTFGSLETEIASLATNDYVQKLSGEMQGDRIVNHVETYTPSFVVNRKLIQKPQKLSLDEALVALDTFDVAYQRYRTTDDPATIRDLWNVAVADNNYSSFPDQLDAYFVDEKLPPFVSGKTSLTYQDVASVLVSRQSQLK